MKAKISHFFPYLALGASLILFLALVLKNINYPIWFDEGYSAYLIKGNFAEIWQLTALDVHPPFYYFLLKIWSLIFGDSLVALRLMSVFFGVASLIMLFFLIKRLFGARPAALATLISSVSPFLIRYGMEMRMYMVILFIVLSATFCLSFALEKNRKIYWALYAILMALGMYTHYFTILVWLSELLYLVIIKKRPLLKPPLIFTYLGAILLYLPWVPALLSQLNSISGGFWIPEATVLTPLNFLTDVFIFKSASEIAGFLAVLFVAFLVAYVYIVKQSYKETYLLQFLVILPPLILLLISALYKPMFIDRYLVPSSVLIWTLLGVSLALFVTKKRPAKIFRALAFVLACSVLVIGVRNVLSREPDSHVAEIIEVVKEDPAPILASDIWTFFGAEVYSLEESPVYGTLETTFTNGWGSEEPMKYYEEHLSRSESGVYKTLDDFTAENKEFWYIIEGEEETLSQDFELKDELKAGNFTALKFAVK